MRWLTTTTLLPSRFSPLERDLLGPLDLDTDLDPERENDRARSFFGALDRLRLRLMLISLPERSRRGFVTRLPAGEGEREPIETSSPADFLGRGERERERGVLERPLSDILADCVWVLWL